ncbi:Inositol hexakisphosphate and diphosphoinositol-pentakisphosphate kinase 2 [Thelohanellus kitauei]|uniref:Inositol hexakisphosphate and diphosphoinositol-pentakisphosphate kinase n=1 Tax=Thelohanellus kitauei TaxID=669202 RepID=A0A0C2MCU2_THEKT|nr:Inositol hexakisphosphate and diphosphoinositol-pentakisphosphate kinase 2 [Thelohanellus kitauei]
MQALPDGVEIVDIHLSEDRCYNTFMSKIREIDKIAAYRLVSSRPGEEPTKIVAPQVISLGISSRNKKVFSKPMVEILYRICRFGCVDVILFPDEVVRSYPVWKWPIVRAFLCFYAKGYKLGQAWDYVRLRRPFLLNDISNQKLLLNRHDIYFSLTENGIPVPNHIFVRRDPVTLKTYLDDVIEDEDSITYGGKTLTKPFVEKPFDAENHNLNIYFPVSVGGGCQKLFRKMGNRSSFYCKESKIRRDSSYLYEQFILTDGADVKVYCVGPEFAYAEARKSPALDGKVERDHNGKEMRYPVILAPHEKYVAKRVVELLQQNVCGIDMLRTGNQCYVCDVNGVSFVKKSVKYYDDCAYMIAVLVYGHFCEDLNTVLAPFKVCNGKPKNDKASKKGSTLELVSVIAIIRHGDRTPKQKMKMLTRNGEFFKLFDKYGGRSEGRIKLKKPSELQDVLDVTNSLISSSNRKCSQDAMDNPAKLFQMKYVLEMYGEFLGFNRKVQIKCLDDKRNKILEFKFKAYHPFDSSRVDFTEGSLLLVLKWGGELTEVGRLESEEFGHNFAQLYPNNPLLLGETKAIHSKFSSGLLRLHSTYRHNMKVFASDEGRVQLTAAAFARGMLSLESQLAPILVHLVKCDKQTTEMLDSSNQVEFKLHEVKKSLHDKLSVNRHIDEKMISEITSQNQTYLKSQLRELVNPFEACSRIHHLIYQLYGEICEKFKISPQGKYIDPSITSSVPDIQLCHSETVELMERRWGKLLKDFRMQNNNYDISLIPDIYDCARYDFYHNSKLNLKYLPELYECAKQIAQVVIAQEYGITPEEKLLIGKDVCNRLVRKISSDLTHNFNIYDDEGHVLDAEAESNIANPSRRVRTRLYFTSESHIYGFMNILRYGGLFDSNDGKENGSNNIFDDYDSIGELDFLSHILIMQYEDLLVEKNSPERFLVEIFFSPGNKRTKPITKSRQLTRPSIDRNQQRKTNSTKKKADARLTQDDCSATLSPYSEKSAFLEINSSDQDRIVMTLSENENDQADSCNSDQFNITNFRFDVKRFRKPRITPGKFSQKSSFVADSIHDRIQIGKFIPRQRMVQFLESFLPPEPRR